MTTIYIETFNCSYNAADSEYMAALLKQAKFDPVDNLPQGDIVILNVRSVRGPSAAEILQRLEWIKKEYPYKGIVIVGCVANSDPDKFKKCSVVGAKQIHHIVEVVEEILHNNIVHLLEREEMPPLTLPKIRKNASVEIIPLDRGCLSACAFCKTKGVSKLESYPILKIAAVAQKAISEGVQQIWLTSQDSMLYGKDINTSLVALLAELITLSGDFKIRLDPGNAADFMNLKSELTPLFSNPKLFQFLWLTIPSGSNRILKELKFNFTKEQILDALAELEAQMPLLTFASSIQVGFPAETEEDHIQTTDLLRKLNPDLVLVSRHQTALKGAKAKLPSEEVILHRLDFLQGVSNNISSIRNEQWRGWKGTLLIEEQSKEAGVWIGRTASYKPMSIVGNFQPGQKVAVKVVKTGISEIRAEVDN